MAERLSLRNILIGGTTGALLTYAAVKASDNIYSPTPLVFPEFSLTADGSKVHLTSLYFSGDFSKRQIDKGIRKAKRFCEPASITEQQAPSKKDIFVRVLCK